MFTDGSSDGIAACTFKDKVVTFQTLNSCARVVELQAIAAVLSASPEESLNVYMDSAYLAHPTPLLEPVGHIRCLRNSHLVFMLSKTYPKTDQEVFLGTP